VLYCTVLYCTNIVEIKADFLSNSVYEMWAEGGETDKSTRGGHEKKKNLSNTGPEHKQYSKRAGASLLTHKLKMRTSDKFGQCTNGYERDKQYMYTDRHRTYLARPPLPKPKQAIRSRAQRKLTLRPSVQLRWLADKQIGKTNTAILLSR
jgi:hypothetical protein